MIDLEHLSPAAQKALEGADLALLEEWNGPLARPDEKLDRLLSVGEKPSATEQRHADYAALGYVHAWPPRGRCDRCKKPTGWAHPELGHLHPWLCIDDRGVRT